jgi:hypothetical protein
VFSWRRFLGIPYEGGAQRIVVRITTLDDRRAILHFLFTPLKSRSKATSSQSQKNIIAYQFVFVKRQEVRVKVASESQESTIDATPKSLFGSGLW